MSLLEENKGSVNDSEESLEQSYSQKLKEETNFLKKKKDFYDN